MISCMPCVNDIHYGKHCRSAEPVYGVAMHFWNGNKSPARQRYELEVLQAVLDAVHHVGELHDNRTDYPSAEDEGNIFGTGVDILVTVLGNPKFADKDKIVINRPLARGMLGKRLLVIRQPDQQAFSAIRTEADMKNKIAGIPATWADADLFRANGYPVAENGSLDDIFFRLADREFDYVSLGALEVEEIHTRLAVRPGGLCMETTLMLQYPMPLVFYVNPAEPEVAERIRKGVDRIQQNGQMEALFQRHFGGIVERLSLEKRRTFHLFNPMLAG